MSPNRPYRAAAEPEVDLGGVVSTHAKRTTVAGRVVSALLFSGPALVLGGRAVANDVPVFDPTAPLLLNAVWFLILVILPLASVVSIVNAVRHRDDVVFVHERGLRARVSGVETLIPFTDVQSLQSRVVRTRGGVVHDHKLRFRGGRLLALNGDYDRIETLTDAIRANTLAALVERAREELDAGRSVTFGPWSLESAALVVRGTRLPRAVLDRVDLRSGTLYVCAKQRDEAWAEQDVAEIPNVHVLLALLESGR